MSDNELQERVSQHPSLGSSGERVPTAAGSSREAAAGSAEGASGGTAAAAGSAGEAAAADKQKESAKEVNCICLYEGSLADPVLAATVPCWTQRLDSLPWAN